MILMKLNSLVDPKKEELIREAIRKKDASLLMKKKPAEEPARDTKPDDKRIQSSSLEVFIPSKPGVTMEEALAKAEAEKRVIASNRRLDQALVGSDEWESIRDVFACWTGTMSAYEEVGKPFGEVVEYVDDQTKLKYLFVVPQNYRGKTDCILVAEHPDYSLEIKGNDRIVRAAVVDLIERFPAETQKWYLADPKHGIPFGEQVDSSDSNARYLWRIEKRVGPVARSYDYYYGDNRRYVLLDDWPSGGLGVAVESRVSGSESRSATKK